MLIIEAAFAPLVQIQHNLTSTYKRQEIKRNRMVWKVRIFFLEPPKEYQICNLKDC